MKEEIQRTVNVFSGLELLYTFTAGIAVLISTKIGFNVMMATSLWMIIVVLFPATHLLKISPFKRSEKPSKNMPAFEIIVLILLFWSFYFLIAAGVVLIPGVVEILGNEFGGNLVGNKIMLVLIVPILEELVYRGVLLNRLREYGDGFAIIITSIIFSIAHYGRFIVVMFAAIMLGIIYVVTNDLKISILFHILVNSSVFLLNQFQINNREALFFFGVIFGLCMITILWNKKLKQFFMSWRLKNIKKQLYLDKEKYHTVWHAGGFIAYLGFMGLNIVMSIMMKVSLL